MYYYVYHGFPIMSKGDHKPKKQDLIRSLLFFINFPVYTETDEVSFNKQKN
jgi:hypothetical protein